MRKTSKKSASDVETPAWCVEFRHRELRKEEKNNFEVAVVKQQKLGLAAQNLLIKLTKWL